VCDEKTNVCKPLQTHRNNKDGIGTGPAWQAREKGAPLEASPEPGGDLCVVLVMPGV
jgi:hypothetical protein